MPIWRSANDTIMSAGRDSRIPPTHIVQLIGILPDEQCRYNRVGQVWINPMYLWDTNQQLPCSDLSVQKMYMFRNDASSLKDLFQRPPTI
eukprot:1483243-Pyramimonas_sp.AAC.2